MHILGLDFGTKTGAAWGYAGIPPSQVQTETWELPAGGGECVGAFGRELRRLLRDRLVRGVEAVVFEAPYVATGRDFRGRTVHRPDQLRRAFGCAWECEVTASDHGIAVYEVPPSSLKKSFAGHGRAEKSEMLLAARRRGFTVANDHEADALACWLHGVAHLAPQHACTYDPLFSREPGA